jgi:hypothetical protein
MEEIRRGLEEHLRGGTKAERIVFASTKTTQTTYRNNFYRTSKRIFTVGRDYSRRHRFST